MTVVLQDFLKVFKLGDELALGHVLAQSLSPFCLLTKPKINLLLSIITSQETVPLLQEIETDASGARTLNCTVAYIAECMSLSKCLDTCRGVGASGYRFFPDGCCQCFGSTCKDNGVDKTQCSKCPSGDEDGPEFGEEEELYIHRDVEEEAEQEELRPGREDEDAPASKKGHPEMQNDISSG